MKIKNKVLLSCLGIAIASTVAFANQPDQSEMFEMIYGNNSTGQVPYSAPTDVTQPVSKQINEQVTTEQVQPTQAVTQEPAQTPTLANDTTPYYNNWSLFEAQEKVNAIGYKLLSNSQLTDWGITFKVSDEATVNAYADGNRNVVVFTGLLQLCESEDELAFILSHEIAHIAGSHIAKGNITRVATNVGTAVAKSKLSGIRAKVAKVAKEYGAEELGIGSDVVGTAVDATGAAVVNYHSRAHEIDADTVGMDIMKKANYNPMAGIAIMYRIGDDYNDIFVDHPSTDKRVSKMFNHATDNYPTDANKGYNSRYYKEAIGLMQNK